MRRPRFSLGRWVGPSLIKRKGVLAAAISALLVAGVGCGESEGVAAGATVTAYVEAPLCSGAQGELAKAGGRAGEVRVRVVCLASVDSGSRVDLAQVGANARRATEDSTTVGYLEPPTTPSFSRPIVEAANIAAIRMRSGQTAMAQLLHAIGDANTSASLRNEVRKNLG